MTCDENSRLLPDNKTEKMNDKQFNQSLNGTLPWYCSGPKLIVNFIIVAVAFSINHATVTTVLGLSSSVLVKSQTQTSSGLLYCLYTFSALTFASGLVQATGGRKALIAGLFLYCFYVASFLIVFYVEQPSVRWAALVVGATIGGFAAGWLWTAQGAFFSRTCQLYCDATGTNSGDITATLGGLFAFIYVGFEVVCKALGKFIIPDNCNHDCAAQTTLYLILTVSAVASAFAMFLTRELPSETADSEGREPATKKQLFSVRKLLLAGNLLVSSKKMVALAPLNVSFGFMSSMINTYINSQIVTVSVPKQSDQFLIYATIPAVACVLSLPFGWLAKYTGKLSLMLFGGVCYVTICVWVIVFTEWKELGYGIIGMYVLAGVGRAVFEGTNKAVFADFFPNEKEAAFSCVIVQSGLSATLGFFLFPLFSKDTQAAICLFFSAISLVGLTLAFYFHKKEKEFTPIINPMI